MNETRTQAPTLPARPEDPRRAETALLTDQEVISRLRLGEGRTSPKDALKHLRRMRKIDYVRVGKRVLYTEAGVARYVARHLVRANP